MGGEIVEGWEGNDPVVCIGVDASIPPVTAVDVASAAIISMRNISFAWSAPYIVTFIGMKLGVPKTRKCFSSKR